MNILVIILIELSFLFHNKETFFYSIFKATFLNNDNEIGLTFDSQGSVYIQLPKGPSYDFFKLYLFVQIFDDSDAITVFSITTPVVVEVNSTLAENLALDVLSSTSGTSSILADLANSDLKSSVNTILTITSMINENAGSITETVNSDRMKLLKKI
jgi:hypothetical protein